jgi:hypothetical protein
MPTLAASSISINQANIFRNTIFILGAANKIMSANQLFLDPNYSMSVCGLYSPLQVTAGM